MTAAQQPIAPKALAIVNARLLDPASDYDGPGAVLIEDGRIVEVIHGQATQRPEGVQIIDAEGRCLAPGLIDIRVKTGEPGNEPKETLKSASLSAAAGGVTTIVVQPDTDPAIDDPALIDHIQRRGAALDLVHVRAAGAATQARAAKAGSTACRQALICGPSRPGAPVCTWANSTAT